jgi:hypothetical protein
VTGAARFRAANRVKRLSRTRCALRQRDKEAGPGMGPAKLQGDTMIAAKLPSRALPQIQKAAKRRIVSLSTIQMKIG